MEGRLDIQKWIRVRQAAYAAAALAGGQYMAVGTELGLEIYDLTGECRLIYPPDDVPLPIVQLAATEFAGGEDSKRSLGCLYVGARQGWVVRLVVERQQGKKQFKYAMKLLYEAPNDLRSLSAAGDGRMVAVGHYLPALAVFDADGVSVWRQCDADGTATHGEKWLVALDRGGDNLYVGSAGKGSNWLVNLEPRTGLTRAHLRLGIDERAFAVTALPGKQGVVAALSVSLTTGRLVAYDPGLARLTWELTFDKLVTALAADSQAPLVAAAVGPSDGEIVVIDAQSGKIVASGLFLKTEVRGLSIVNGQMIAAATEDGQLALIHYESGVFRL